MANFRALVRNSGLTSQQIDADSLIVGAGIVTASGDLTITPAGSNITIATGKTLGTTGTGNINLPQNASARFQIEGVATTATVTASNLTTLTNGSNADALHTHSGVTATEVQFAGTSGEALDAGELVCIDDASGTPKIFKADANGAGELVNAIGICNSTVGAADLSVVVYLYGERAIPDAQWDSVPATSDVGKPVYMSATAGNLTLTAPTTAGYTQTRVGWVSAGGAGTSRMIIAKGEPVVL